MGKVRIGQYTIRVNDLRDAGPFLYRVHEYVGGGWWHIDTIESSAGGLYAPIGQRIARKSGRIRQDRFIRRNYKKDR